jgi:hypothetical protein
MKNYAEKAEKLLPASRFYPGSTKPFPLLRFMRQGAHTKTMAALVKQGKIFLAKKHC